MIRKKKPILAYAGCVGVALALILCGCGDDEGADNGTQPPSDNPGTDTPGNNGGNPGDETPGNNGGNNPGDENPGEDCVSNEEYFLREVWSPVLSQSCFNCHNPLGAASDTDMVYEAAGQVGFLERNLAVFNEVSEFERDGVSVVLLKPTGQVEHGGGALFDADSDAYKALQAMLDRKANPVVCPEEDDSALFYEGVELASPAETLRKATLQLAGRLPGTAELEQVDMHGEQGLEAALGRMLREDSFYLRMEELFNDILLTNKYVGGDQALDLLSRDYYPMARWFENEEMAAAESPAFVEAAARYTNNSVAQEPLKLVSFLLRNDRPFTELITADYIVVNPFSAKSYGIDDIEWEDPMDPNEYKAGRIPGIPHAGVLTSPMFLNRFPTTETNRNRHRARIIYDYFLATDVLKLAERPIDPTSAVHNPTRNDSQCAGCHAVIDPLAGTLQHWNERGGYEPVETWYEDMRSPGFDGEVLPAEERTKSVNWLANKIAKDRRFAHAMVRLLYKAVIGQEPLSLPTGQEPHHEALLSAYENQQKTFDIMAKEFEANNHDIRVVVRSLIQSVWFRANNYRGEMDEVRAAELEHLGTGRLLTPEMLNRKLNTILGYPWRSRADRGDHLLSTNDYLILYGGIDSDDVTERIVEPNGIMTGVQLVMANEMVCRFTARDFTLPAEQRILFPMTETSFVPEDENDFEIPGAIDAIRKNIQYLHWHVLGERLDLNDPEIDQTYALFYETWREGRALMANEEVGNALHWGCQARNDYWTGASYEKEVRYDQNYSIRAWMAVLTYLLTDHKFLYE